MHTYTYTHAPRHTKALSKAVAWCLECMFLRGMKTSMGRACKQMEETDHICSGSVSFGPVQAIKAVADSVNTKALGHGQGAAGSSPCSQMHWSEHPQNSLILAKGCKHLPFSPCPLSVLDLAKLTEGKPEGSGICCLWPLCLCLKAATAAFFIPPLPCVRGKVKSQDLSEQIQEKYNNLCSWNRETSWLVSYSFLGNSGAPEWELWWACPIGLVEKCPDERTPSLDICCLIVFLPQGLDGNTQKWRVGVMCSALPP